MDTTKQYLLVLLALLLVYRVLVQPWVAGVDGWAEERASLASSLARAEYLLAHREEAGALEATLREADAANRALFFAGEGGEGGALTALQKQFAALLAGSGLTAGSVAIGEPMSPAGGGYRVLPLSFTASGSPAQLRAFTEAIGQQQPLLLLDSLQVQSQKNSLQVSGQVRGFYREEATAAAGVEKPEKQATTGGRKKRAPLPADNL